jgi:predicted anti-sigma-YlaC factor YlaD
MVVNCELVWREVSNYIDGESDPALRTAIDEHVRRCRECSAVIDGTRNVVKLYGDERMQEAELPFGFRRRLQRRLDESMPKPRRTFLGWVAAAAAAMVLAGSFEIFRVLTRPQRQQMAMAQPGKGVPPNLQVVVEPGSRLFHLEACTFIHDRTHLRKLTASEAQRQGFTPCDRCLKKYLSSA